MIEGGDLMSGIFPVVPTPLTDSGEFDEGGMAHLVGHYADSGCHGVVVLGSGGEYPYFTFDEKLKITETAVSAAGGRFPVIVGAGFFGLVEAAKFIEGAALKGADAFLAALPAYYSVNFEDALGFYRELCKTARKPILYYHYPQITGLNFSAEQTGKILSIEGIAGIKASSLNIRQMKSYMNAVNGNTAMFSGASFLLLETLRMGGCGVICPVPSVAPELVVDCFNAYGRGDGAEAERLRERIMDFVPLLNTFDVPAGLQKFGLRVVSRLPFSTGAGAKSRHAVIKEALRQLGHPITSKVRSPLPQITDKEKRAVEKFLKSVEIR